MRKLRNKLHLAVEVYQHEQKVEEVEVMNHHLAQELEIWDLEVDEDTEVKKDGEGGQAHRVYWKGNGNKTTTTSMGASTSTLVTTSSKNSKYMGPTTN